MADKQEQKEAADRPELDEKLSELEILKQSLDQKAAKQKETYDQLLRMGADFENFRKNAEKRISQAKQYGKEEILLQVVGLADLLIHAVDASQKTDDLEALKKGMSLSLQQFEKFLKDQGLVAIKSVGETLDPHKHEALAQEEDDDVEEGTILGEIQRGYMLGDQVIRTAKVRVSAKSKQTVSQTQETQEEK